MDEPENGPMHLGSITIDYFLSPSGEPIVGIESEGDLALLTKLGMLDFARDTFFRHPGDDDEEDE